METVQFDAVTERIKERSLLPPEDPKYLTRDDAKVAIKNYLGSKQSAVDAPEPESQQPLGPVDRWRSMLSNIAPSAKGVYRDYVATPLASPFETLGNLGKLPIGLYNKGVNAVGLGGIAIPGQGEAERAVSQYGERLSDRYGSPTKAEQTLVDDPVGAVAEVGSLLAGGRSVAGAAKAGVKGAASAVAENLPKAVAKKADAWSEMLYRKAIAPPNKQSLSEFNIKKGLRYGKENKIAPSMETLEQSRADASALGKKTSEAFDNGVATTVRYNVKESFNDLASFADKHKNSPEHVAAAKSAMERFTKPTPALRKEMGISSNATPEQIAAAIKRGDVAISTKTAQQIKKDIYDKHGARPWNDPDTMPLKTEAEKAIASGLRKSVAKRHETLRTLLEEESALHAWQDTAAQKILRDARNPWLSLGKKVVIGGAAAGGGGAVAGLPGAAVGLGLELMTTPKFKSKVSFLLDELANRGVKADKAAVEKILAANADKIDIFDHNLPKLQKLLTAGTPGSRSGVWPPKDPSNLVGNAPETYPLGANSPTTIRDNARAAAINSGAEFTPSQGGVEQFVRRKGNFDARLRPASENIAAAAEEGMGRSQTPLETFVQRQARILAGVPEGKTVSIEGIGPNGKRFTYTEDARTAVKEAFDTIDALDSAGSALSEGKGSLPGNLKKAGVAPAVKTDIFARAKKYEAEGFTKEEAAASAMNDAAQEWQATRKSILSQLGIKP